MLINVKIFVYFIEYHYARSRSSLYKSGFIVFVNEMLNNWIFIKRLHLY